MTIVTDLRDPWIEVVDGGGAIRVLLGEHSLLLSTVTECRALIEAAGRALHYLDERQRLLNDRADRDAARGVNAARGPADRRLGTYPQAFERLPAPPRVDLRFGS